MQRAGSDSALAQEVTRRGKYCCVLAKTCSRKKIFSLGCRPDDHDCTKPSKFFFLCDGSTKDESVAPQGREPFSTRGESESGVSLSHQAYRDSLCWSSE